MADVFVSYAREDQEIARRLYEELSARGRQVWVDWEGIEPSDLWLQSVFEAIDDADAFVFLISPFSLESAVCAAELEHAVAQNKRLVPVVAAEPAEGGGVPPALAERDWVFLPPRDEWDHAVGEILRAVDLDIDLVRVHSSVLARARAWQMSGRRDTPLLRGEELDRAEQWLARAAGGAEPKPTGLEASFIVASRRASTRRHRWVAGASAVVAVLTLSLAVVALVERSQAVRDEHTAQSRLLAAEAQSEIGTDASLSTLLAEKALRVANTSQAGSALRDALESLGSLVVFRGDTGAVHTAAFSANGSEVVTASDDGTARIWSARSGAQLRVLRVGKPLNSAAFSPGGDEVVTTSNDRTVRTWDAATGGPRLRITLNGPTPTDAVYSPNGSELLVAATNGSTIIFNARTGARLEVLRVPGDGSTIETAVLNRTGSEVLTASSDGAARTWDVSTAKQLRVLPAREVESATFSPDGSQALTVSKDGDADVIDLATNRVVTTLSGTFNIEAAAFSPDGSQVVTGNINGSVWIWDIHNGTPLAGFSGPSMADNSAVYSPNGQTVLTSSEDGTAEIWQSSIYPQRLVMGNTNDFQMTSAAFSPNGSEVVTTDANDDVITWGAKTGAVMLEKQGNDSLNDDNAVFSPDGREILVANYEGVPHVFDARTGRALLVLRDGGKTNSAPTACFSPDGSEILTVSGDNTGFQIWGSATGHLRLTVPGRGRHFYDATFSPNGSEVVTADGDGTAEIFQAATGELVRVLPAGSDAINSAVFSPNGAEILTAGDDDTARLWDARTGHQLSEVTLTQPVISVGFSPDGSRFITAGEDDRAEVWSAQTGQELMVMNDGGGGGDFDVDASFSPSGGEAVTASYDGTSRIWSMQLTGPLSVLSSIARQLVTRPLSPQERALYLAGIGN